MDGPEHGSPEHFFEHLATFLKANARGRSRCLVVIETEGGDFWIQSMVENQVWIQGMLSMAAVVNNAKHQHNVFMSARKMEEVVEQQELAAMEVPGKKQ
jgi:hypothetical protein